MTDAQAKWLREHRSEKWEAVGRGHAYAKRGVLHADGEFVQIYRGQRMPIKPGSFEVGVRQERR